MINQPVTHHRRYSGKRLLIAAGIAALGLFAGLPASAALPEGGHAPDFRASGALGGKPFAFHLAQALKRGPVVLYFYPKAFTEGCTLEAHAFAAAMDDFHRAGATVLGLSADDPATLAGFSSRECSSRFPVASASPATIAAYDAALRKAGTDTGLADRITYVIAPDGRITLAYGAMDWRDHVPRALAAVRALGKR